MSRPSQPVLLVGIPAQDSPAEMPNVGSKHSAEARLAERRVKKIPDFMAMTFVLVSR